MSCRCFSLRRIPSLLVAVALLLGGSAVGTLAPAAHADVIGARRVTAWIPYWDQTRAMQSFLNNADLYSAASPFWYELAASGGISRYAGAEDATVISSIHGKGVKVIPTITNNFDPTRVSGMLASDASRTAHVQALVDLVQAMGYDGIDVDYESMAATDRDRFSAFITSLAGALHPLGKLLTVAVHAKTSEPGTWSGPQAQNYAAIGAAADRVRVMAYDYSWNTSPAGPIAPLSWVDSVAAFAASAVPPSKVELGMSLYGYDWVGSQGEGVTYDTTTARLASFGATRVWDATAAEPTFTYTTNGSNHTVYYADAQSAAARLGVVDKYSLAGASFWRLGGEDPGVWTAVRNHWPSTTSTSTTSTSDTTAPTAPATLSATSGSRRIYLSWSAATDGGGSGLAGYEILRATSSGGAWTLLAKTSTLLWTDTHVTKGRSYWYAARAYDGAGNRSANSPVRSATAR